MLFSRTRKPVVLATRAQCQNHRATETFKLQLVFPFFPSAFIEQVMKCDLSTGTQWLPCLNYCSANWRQMIRLRCLFTCITKCYPRLISLHYTAFGHLRSQRSFGGKACAHCSHSITLPSSSPRHDYLQTPLQLLFLFACQQGWLVCYLATVQTLRLYILLIGCI